ncbi:adenylyltransferase/cytidyltransferase family protein [Geopseudomonas aromaticivorans]
MLEIVVYGGAFNPPHAGHADAIRQLAHVARRILVVPSYRHAFGKDMAPFDLRLSWLRRIVERLAAEGVPVEVDDCERQLAIEQHRPLYSWDLLSHIAAREGLTAREVGFVVGEDNLAALARFHRAEELLRTFPLVLAREQVPLHSTMIRQAAGDGREIEALWLAPGLTPHDYAFFAGASQGRPQGITP